MAAKLIVEEGVRKGLILSLDDGEEWVVGRDPDESRFSLEDPSVSRKHLVLRTSPDGIVLENLSLTNPTQVNGKNVEEPILLTQGDTVRVGGSLFRFYATPEAQITEKEEDLHDTIFEDEEDERFKPKNELAEINFDLGGQGRWLLKVISGPNTGAEYSMHSGSSYLIGTDRATCDVVFHDNSVSRQHARIEINEEGEVSIEDLGSRNGTVIDGKKSETKQKIGSNTLISTGTTSFLIFDREGEMQTIVSPILPSIMKAVQPEEPPEKEEKATPPSPEMYEAARAALDSQVIKPAREKPKTNFGAFMMIGIITGVFVLAGIGTMMLFRAAPIKVQEEADADQLLTQAIKTTFPNVEFNFNKSTGRLILIGHVLTVTDKNLLLYNLQGLKFIKNIDDSGLIIDEYVWKNINQILNKNANWKGISIHSPRPGHYVISGYLKSRKDAEDLYDYLNANFDYLDLLEKKIVVEEDVVNSLTASLKNAGLSGVKVEMSNGTATFTGGIPTDKTAAFNQFLNSLKASPEIRSIKNFVQQIAPESTVVNISSKYRVSGVSQFGKNISVVINGRILSKGDVLDGMEVTDISKNTVWLQRDNVKYRIDH